MDQAKKLRKILRKSRLLSPVSVLATLFMTACAVILVLQFAVNIYNVRGDGMQPSIHDGGIIITDSIAYKFRSPSRGDVVVAGGHVLRVIGLPDETITIHGGEIFMDGILLSEPYITASVQTWPVADQETFILGTNEYFLLADDRGCYDDSRSGRVYTKEEILEKVIFGT